MQQPTPSPAPAIAGTPPVVGAPQAIPSRVTAQEMYQAMRAQRRELGRQLESLEQKRTELQGQLQQSGDERITSAVDRKGIEQRLSDVDARIADVDKQISAADQAVSRSAAVPGAAIEAPPPRDVVPEEAFVLGGIFLFVAIFPISIAFARRIWRRGAAAITTMPKEFGDRMTRLEQAVDAVALEMERVGEGQRFVTNILAERESLRALGAGAAEPIEVRQRERAHAER